MQAAANPPIQKATARVSMAVQGVSLSQPNMVRAESLRHQVEGSTALKTMLPAALHQQGVTCRFNLITMIIHPLCC